MTGPYPDRSREAGGIAIVVVFGLLAIASLAALTLGRHSLREALVTGNESTGRKAYEMADSGVDYLITWSNTTSPSAPTATAQTLQSYYTNLLDAIDPINNTFTGMAADGTISVTMLGSSVGGDMTPGTSGYLQSSTVAPSFDLQMFYLGHPFATTTSQGSPMFMAYSTGHATIGTTGQSFISRRQVLVY